MPAARAKAKPPAAAQEKKTDPIAEAKHAPAAHAPVAAAYSGPGPCKHALKGHSPIVKACAEGGLKAAKSAMKNMVKEGKAVGMKCLVL